MESLPDEVIEHILERLPVKTLLKFKCVSKQWKSTIQSPCFEKRQMLHRKQSGDPEVLLVSVYPYDSLVLDSVLRTLVVGSSVSVKIPIPLEYNQCYILCNTSCDGLICLYHFNCPCIVVNPTTRWHRTFPRCNYQLAFYEGFRVPSWTKNPSPGFGKDKINGTYKSVWVYNSAEIGLNNNATTCEVFDFTTNAWRYVVPASPYLILHDQSPVYVDGSLHWLTAWQEGESQTKVLSFDLHTETFQVISKVPFHHHFYFSSDISMCNLDDRLCVIQQVNLNQVIWSFDSDSKTWKTIYSIDRQMTYSWFKHYMSAFQPLAILKKDKLLYYDRQFNRVLLVTHDPKTKSYDLACKSCFRALAICYFPSLISIS